MWDKLSETEKRYREIEAEMARPEVASDYERLQAMAREHASLEEVVSLLHEYRHLQDSLAQARSIVQEGGDPELGALARPELPRHQASLEAQGGGGSGGGAPGPPGDRPQRGQHRSSGGEASPSPRAQGRLRRQGCHRGGA